MNNDHRELLEAPITAALTVLAQTKRDLIDADIKARAAWGRLSAPEVILSHLIEGHDNNVGNFSRGKVLESSAVDAAWSTARFYPLNENPPTWLDDQHIKTGAPADRLVFMDIISLAQECKQAIQAHEATGKSYGEAQKEWANELKTGSVPWCYEGLYVDVRTSRRQARGWVVHVTQKSITIEVDPTGSGLELSSTGVGRYAVYEPRNFAQRLMNNLPNYKTLLYSSEPMGRVKFNLDTASVTPLIPTVLAAKRKGLMLSWIRGMERAYAERDRTYEQWEEWWNTGGSGPYTRREKIEAFDWKMPIDPMSGFSEYQDRYKMGRAWTQAAVETMLNMPGVLEHVEGRARRQVFVNTTGGDLTQDEQDILAKMPVTEHRSETMAVVARFIELGVVDPYRTLF